MCALLNFIKVFCIVLHILTFHSLRWDIYSPPSPTQPKGVTTSESYRCPHPFFFAHCSQRKKCHPDFDFVHQ